MEILFWISDKGGMKAIRLQNRKIIDIAYEKDLGVGSVVVGEIVKQSREGHFLVDFSNFQGFLEVKANKIAITVEHRRLKSKLPFEIVREGSMNKLSKVVYLEEGNAEEVSSRLKVGECLKKSRYFHEKLSHWLKLGVSKIFVESSNCLEKLNELFFDDISSVEIDVNTHKRSLIERFEIVKGLDTLFRKNIYTDRGAYFNVDFCQACTVIDVNSGNYLKTALEVNLEVIEDIVRLIVARKVSGLIIIDFLNMPHSGEEQVKEALKKAFEVDRVSVSILGFTRGKLFEITRKKEENYHNSSSEILKFLEILK